MHNQFADGYFGLVRPGTENGLKWTLCERPEMGMCLEILSYGVFSVTLYISFRGCFEMYERSRRGSPSLGLIRSRDLKASLIGRDISFKASMRLRGEI